MTRLHVLAPTYKPVGGVVKIIDYASHALAAGWDVKLWCPDVADPALPLFGIERFVGLLEDIDTGEIGNLQRPRGEPVFFSWPTHYELVGRTMRPGESPLLLIHIIQNVRHANPSWEGGYPLRLLTRPMTRITTNEVVQTAIVPYVHPGGETRVIPLGHPQGFFHKERDGLHTPLRVAYTTWKSDIGDRVAERMASDDVVFRAIREHVDWSELRDLYHWADVFLGTPNPEEGFYMPAFEAMEAGCLVVVPDAGGNMAYCRFGENCLSAEHEDSRSYVGALEEILRMTPERVSHVRHAGWMSLEPFDLESEGNEFVHLLANVAPGRAKLRRTTH